MTAALTKPLYITRRMKIVVMTENVHGPTGRWRCGIKPHHCFKRQKTRGCLIYVWRARLVLTEKLGRSLRADEHAHHKNGRRGDDRPRNIERLTAADHNRHHKTGSKHKASSRQKVSATLRRMYASGEMVPHPHYGTKNRSAKLTPRKVRRMRSLYRPRQFGFHRIAKMFNVSIPAARAAITGKTWSAVQ